MQIGEVPRKLWQVISFLFVLYGFYLFFLFVWDTMIRINESAALLVASISTLALAGVSGILWAKKHLKRLSIRT